MSANKKNESKTKLFEDENIDSGFQSGPIDQWSGEVEPEPEPERNTERSDNQKVLCDSGLISGELDSGICDTLSECLSEVKLIDTSTPCSTQTEQFRCTVTSPEETAIPPAHLVIFFQPDDDGDTQLHIASVHGCQKSVATLIKICPNKELLDLTNDQGYTALHLAVMNGNSVVTRMLVRAGLSIGVRDRQGETPLHKATVAGRVECLQALLAPVQELPPRNISAALNQKNYNGQACVHLAASAGNLEVLQTLVFYGADINAKENLAGWSALHYACRRGDVRVATYLRQRGGTSVVRDHAGRTARRVARGSAAYALFADDTSSDDESDADDDKYDSDSESLFERLRESLNTSSSINVA